MLKKSASRLYKICALGGYVIIAAAVVFPLKHLQSLDMGATQAFEQVITSNLEAEGLETELSHIEKVLEKADAETLNGDALLVDGVAYSQYEIERFRKERENIKLFLREKKMNKEAYSSVKDQVINEVKMLFIISSLSMLLGTLLAAFGSIAWFFQLELFEDRRKKNRDE